LFYIIDEMKEWQEKLSTFENRDVYYDYNYASLFSKVEKAYGVRAAYIESNNGKVIYPFILRKLDIELGNSKDIFDIVTPYGYGGPLVEGSQKVKKEFREEFEKYCKRQNIITETIRFHPLLKNYEDWKNYLKVDYIRKTTAVNLTLPIEEVKKSFSKMNKRNIKKAHKNDLVAFEAKKTRENINIFIKMYEETMDKNDAINYYYFSHDYFNKQLLDSEFYRTKLLFVEYNNEVVAGLILLLGNKFAHYHLGASKKEMLNLRPNNLLFDYMIEVAKYEGCHILHLGGGYAEDDGLFKYKSSFTDNYNFDYYLGKKVFNKELYEEVNTQMEKEYELNSTYFPKYRGILQED